MVDVSWHLVVIVYEHCLLGEGIGRILRTHTRAEVVVVPAADHGAVRKAMSERPDVVIFECGRLIRFRDLAKMAPQALLIDVSSAMRPVRSGPAGPGGTARLYPISTRRRMGSSPCRSDDGRD